MNILFICTGNTCRSAMAAALADKMAEDKNLDIRIESAGLFASSGAPASENAVKALSDYGIDLSYHRSKTVTEDLIKQSDLILTMTEAHKNMILPFAPDKTFTLSEYADSEGDVPDPYGGNLDAYKKTAGELYKLLEKAADKLPRIKEK